MILGYFICWQAKTTPWGSNHPAQDAPEFSVPCVLHGDEAEGLTMLCCYCSSSCACDKLIAFYVDSLRAGKTNCFCAGKPKGRKLQPVMAVSVGPLLPRGDPALHRWPTFAALSKLMTKETLFQVQECFQTQLIFSV